MKVTKVIDDTPLGSITIEVISNGQNLTFTGADMAEVAKKAMKADHYFTRDLEIIEDIRRVKLEQENGLR